MKKEPKYCPKCGSAKVHWASGLPQLWSIWECPECGYRGAFVLEDGKLAAKLREKHAGKTGKEDSG
jgi:ribosomal protein L37AE/L43A